VAGSFLRWLLTKGRFPVLALLFLLTAGFSIFAFRIPVERNDDSMVSRGEAQNRAASEFRRIFGNGEEMVLSVTHPRLLEPEGLRLIDELTDRIGKFPGVRRVYSLANAGQVVSGTAGAESVPFVPRPFETPGLRGRILAALDDNPQLASLLVSRDRRTAGIAIEIGDRPGELPYRDETIRAIRRLMARKAGEAELHLSGIGVQKHDVVEFIRRDKAVLLPVSALVLASLLALAFRRVSGVLLPLAVKGIALVWTMGLYSLSGHTLNPITALLPPLIIVFSISTSVHLYYAWLATPGESADKIELIVRETHDLFAPCLYTALATALGLLSLVASDTPAVRQFGIFGALGVLISFAVGITLVPVGLSFLPPRGQGKSPPVPGALQAMLQHAARLSTERPRWVLAAALLLTLAAVAGILRIRNNTDLVRFLKTDAPLYRDTLFIDRNLTGVYSLEFLLSRKDGRPLTLPEDLRKIAAFQEMVARRENVANAFSIADPVRLIHRAETGGEDPGLPGDEDDLMYYFDLMKSDRERSFLGKLMNDDLTLARISVRVHAIGTSAAAPLIRTILDRGKELLEDSYSLVPTGSFLRVTEDSNRLVQRQVVSFSFSLIAILLAIHVFFRSSKLALIASIPNLVPILLTGGIMGFLGVDLSTGTAMIAPVVFGLAVDNTIHYLACYRREPRGDFRQAVARTTTGIGMPLAFSSLILACGFWVGVFGSFKPTIYFSLLTGTTMLAALACVLLVLPACLVLANTERGGTTR
jgi:predicted RND superfamily exporter protein